MQRADLREVDVVVIFAAQNNHVTSRKLLARHLYYCLKGIWDIKILFPGPPYRVLSWVAEAQWSIYSAKVETTCTYKSTELFKYLQDIQQSCYLERSTVRTVNPITVPSPHPFCLPPNSNKRLFSTRCRSLCRRRYRLRPFHYRSIPALIFHSRFRETRYA